ncbi:DUF4116 domain-containing protein [Clostridioides difficile]|nr:DUF4116 domain-containing protein [Clostridioides difficile]
MALQYVREQTEEMCLEAVRQNGLALHFVKDQTEKICIEAVRQDGLAIQFVENQTDEICIEALKQDKLAIRYIKEKDKYLDEFNIKYLEKQGKVREVIAIKENGKWLFSIGCQNNITKEEFIYRIYNTNGGFDPEKGINLHRQIYLKFLEKF